MNKQDNYAEYLGDGVYAEYDGYQIVLKANDHRYPTDTIALEDGVFSNLIQYQKQLTELLKYKGTKNED